MGALLFLVLLALIIIAIAWVIKQNLQSASALIGSKMVEYITTRQAALMDDRVQRHLPHNKLEAIKAYRQLTGVGLKEAKDTIEYYLAHPDKVNEKKGAAAPAFSDAGIRDLLAEGKFEEAVDAYKTFAGVDYFTAREAVETIQRKMETGEATESEDDYVRGEMARLVASGNKMQAIKLYRETTGLGLKESKDAIDALERQLRGW